MQPDITKFQLTNSPQIQAKAPQRVNQLAPVGNFIDNAMGAFGQGLINTSSAVGGLFSKPTTNYVSGNSGTAFSTPTGTPNFLLPSPQPTITQTTKTVTSPTVNPVSSNVPSQNLAIQGSLPAQNTFQQEIPTPSLPTPQTFGQSPITQDGYIPSTAMGSNSTYQDVINKRAQYQKQYEDVLMSAVNVQNQGLQNIERARYSGETQDQANGMTERAQRNADLASLAATNRADAFSKLLNVSQQDVTNTLNAQPNNIGSNVNQATGDVYISRRNPTTGEVETTLAGNIGQQKQYTSTSVNQDPMTGNLIFTGVRQDGTIENQVLGGGQGGSMQSFGGAPATLQAAVGQIGSRQYIDMGNLTSAQIPMAQAYSSKSGIPLLKAEDTTKIKEADATFSSANTLLTTMEGLYKNVITATSAGGIPAQFASKNLGALFRTNEEAKVYSDTVKSFTSLLTRAAGEKGTLSDADKQAIINSIPTFADTIGIADKKMATLRSLFQSSRDGVINSYLGSKAVSQGGSPTIVQTKAGAINTNW